MKEKQKNSFAKDVKLKILHLVPLPLILETGIICTIEGEKLNTIIKNICIEDSRTSCHITNDDTGIYDITEIDKAMKGSSDSMKEILKRKLNLKVSQVDESGIIHTLWPVK